MIKSTWISYKQTAAWLELAIKFGGTWGLRWMGEAKNQQQCKKQHKVQIEKKRKEGVHAWSSRKDKDLYEQVFASHFIPNQLSSLTPKYFDVEGSNPGCEVKDDCLPHISSPINQAV